jgi:hypothetical protein
MDWAEWIMNLPGAAACYVYKQIAGNVVEVGGDVFQGQNIEFTQGTLQELTTVLTLQNTLPGLPERYQIPALVQKGQAILEARMALDPPDRNFTTVQPPASLSMPSTGDATVDAIVRDYLAVMSLDGAVLHANERYEGAMIAGDTASAALQQNAFNTYSAQLASAKAVAAQDDVTLANYLPPLNVNSYPGGANAIAASINAVCSQGLPASLNTNLLGLGLTQTYINSQVCAIAHSVTASTINTNFGPLLTAPRP